MYDWGITRVSLVLLAAVVALLVLWSLKGDR
jgi:hypothetical protein